jgi:hypothetical protein
MVHGCTQLHVDQVMAAILHLAAIDDKGMAGGNSSNFARPVRQGHNSPDTMAQLLSRSIRSCSFSTRRLRGVHHASGSKSPHKYQNTFNY